MKKVFPDPVLFYFAESADPWLPELTGSELQRRFFPTEGWHLKMETGKATAQFKNPHPADVDFLS